MNLEIPIPVTFSIKMTTEKAIIAQNIMLKGKAYIKEAVLPKMFVSNIQEDENGINALVEKWVLQQRYTEENTVDVEAHIDELLSI